MALETRPAAPQKFSPTVRYVVEALAMVPLVAQRLAAVRLVDEALVIVPLVPQNVGNVAYVVEALVIVPLVIIPFVDQKFVKVALVVEELPKTELPETFMAPLIVRSLTVVVPVTARVPPMTISPVEVNDARVSVFKLVLPETERELKSPPDFTVREPLIVALLDKDKYEAERRSNPDWTWGAIEYVVSVAGCPWTTMVEIGCSGTNLAMPNIVSIMPRIVFFWMESSELINADCSSKFDSISERRFSKTMKWFLPSVVSTKEGDDKPSFAKASENKGNSSNASA